VANLEDVEREILEGTSVGKRYVISSM
jgi:hypothetical protein